MWLTSTNTSSKTTQALNSRRIFYICSSDRNDEVLLKAGKKKKKVLRLKKMAAYRILEMQAAQHMQKKVRSR